MSFDFKSDLKSYTGQDQDFEIGGKPQDIGGTKSIGESPSEFKFDFESDLAEFKNKQDVVGPATEQKVVQDIQVRQETINKIEEENRRKQMEIDAASVDPDDNNMQHAYLAPQEELTPTSNIELDYANEDFSEAPFEVVPEGTVGGHCGVYAENIVKLPNGGNWIVGDSIQEKTNSIEKYKNAGLAFLPGEDKPQPGNAVIIDPGTKWGHVAVINNIDENGVATLTESNWNWDKRVTHSRRVSLDDPSIVGFIRTQ